MHCCAWKAINEVLQISCKAKNKDIELESAKSNEKTLRWSEDHFASHSHALIRDTNKQMFLFISLFFYLQILISFWNHVEM